MIRNMTQVAELRTGGQHTVNAGDDADGQVRLDPQRVSFQESEDRAEQFHQGHDQKEVVDEVQAVQQ